MPLFLWVTIHFIQIHTAQAGEPAARFGPFERQCIEKSGARLIKEGITIARLGEANCAHHHVFEVRGNEIFWLRRKGNYEKDPDWTDELVTQRVENSSGKPPVRLASGQGLDFRVSPDAKSVVLLQDKGIFLLDRKTGKQSLLLPPGEDEPDTILEWTENSRRFFLGRGSVGGWQMLGYWEDGKLTWLPHAGSQIDDMDIHYERLWKASSDAPNCHDEGCEKDFKKSRPTKHPVLFITNIRTGDRIEVDRARANFFQPRFGVSGDLTYRMGNEKHSLSAVVIEKRFEEEKKKKGRKNTASQGVHFTNPFYREQYSFAKTHRLQCPVAIVPGKSFGPLRLGMAPNEISKSGLAVNQSTHQLGPFYVQMEKQGTSLSAISTELGFLPDCVAYNGNRIDPSISATELSKYFSNCGAARHLEGGSLIECDGISLSFAGWGGQQKWVSVQIRSAPE